MEWLRSPAGAGPCRLKCQSVTEERRPLPPLPPESLALCSPYSGPFGKQLQSAPLSLGTSLSERGDGLSPSPGTIADRRPLHRAPADLGFLQSPILSTPPSQLHFNPRAGQVARKGPLSPHMLAPLFVSRGLPVHPLPGGAPAHGCSTRALELVTSSHLPRTRVFS